MIRGLLCAAISAGIVLPANCRETDRVPAPATAEANPSALARVVADGVLRDFREPPPFDWGEMVLMAGMMRAHRLTGEAGYRDFVRTWADHWQKHGIGKVLNRPFSGDLTGYCGYWGSAFPVLMLAEDTGDESYLGMAGTVVDYIMTQATRTSDGGFDHWHDNGQLWVDTLYMTTPVLSIYGRLTRQPEYHKEAVRQLAVTTKRLQDPETGLYFHMYDDRKKERLGCLWGRGNGWVIMSRVEVMKNTGRDTGAWADLAGSHTRHLQGLLAVQDTGSGLWYTVLDAPDTYAETSATAMILYGLAETRRLKLSTVDCDEAIESAWAGLRGQVDEHGRVVGVSAGTGPTTKQGYAGIQQGTYTWGTGAFLLAASACSERTMGKRN